MKATFTFTDHYFFDRLYDECPAGTFEAMVQLLQSVSDVQRSELLTAIVSLDGSSAATNAAIAASNMAHQNPDGADGVAGQQDDNLTTGHSSDSGNS